MADRKDDIVKGEAEDEAEAKMDWKNPTKFFSEINLRKFLEKKKSEKTTEGNNMKTKSEAS